MEDVRSGFVILLKMQHGPDAPFLSFQRFRDGEPVAFLNCVHRRMVMARVIEFYVPVKFQKKVKCVPPKGGGRLVEFPTAIKKSA